MPPRLILRLTILMLLLAEGALGQGAVSFVTDLGAEAREGSSNPGSFLEAHGFLYFLAEDNQHGEEIWRTDGTEEGTRLVRDLWPGRKSSGPRLLASTDQRLYFLAFDPVLAWVLWRTDGTEAGTGPLRRWDQAHSPIGWMEPIGERWVLSVWRGTSPNWHGIAVADRDLGQMVEIDVCKPPCSPIRAHVDESQVLFVTRNQEQGGDLWRSDGTERGTRQLSSIDDWNPSTAFLDGVLYYSSKGDLWRTDGTKEGTRRVFDPTPSGGEIGDLVRVGNLIYFGAFDFRDGRSRLWRSDGSSLGTVRVDEIVPAASSVGSLWSSGERLFYEVEADDESDLWVFDGGEARPLFHTRWLRFSRNLFDWVLLATADGSMMTDGTEVLPLPWSFGSPSDPFEGRVYFAGFETGSGRELWSVGPALDSVLVRDLRRPHREALFGSLIPFREQLHFQGGARRSPYVIWDWWASDGQSVRLVDVDGIDYRPRASLADLLVVSSAQPHSFGVYDGTTVEPFFEGLWWSWTEVEDYLFFVPGRSQWLWATDGTPERTELLRMINPDWWNGCVIICDDYPQFLPAQMTSSGSSVFFLANEADLLQLWTSDGTDQGTRPVWTFEVGPYDDRRFIYDTEIAPWRGGALVATQRPKPMLYLSSADGETRPLTELPGVSVRSLEVADDRAVMVIRDELARDSLWQFDGSVVEPLSGLPPGSVIGEMVAVGSRVFFTANAPSTGSELWLSDGTEEETRLVADIAPGSRSSTPLELTPCGEQLLFAADDGTTGQEPWLTDGSVAGTRRLADLAPGPGGSAPEDFVVDGRWAFFVADDGSRRGLFAFDRTMVFSDGFESGSSSAWGSTTTETRVPDTVSEGLF